MPSFFGVIYRLALELYLSALRTGWGSRTRLDPLVLSSVRTADTPGIVHAAWLAVGLYAVRTADRRGYIARRSCGSLVRTADSAVRVPAPRLLRWSWLHPGQESRIVRQEIPSVWALTGPLSCGKIAFELNIP